MTRTIPLAVLEDGQVKAAATKRPSPRFVTPASEFALAKARDTLGKLSPRAQAAAIRFIEALAKDEAPSRAKSDHNI